MLKSWCVLVAALACASVAWAQAGGAGAAGAFRGLGGTDPTQAMRPVGKFSTTIDDAMAQEKYEGVYRSDGETSNVSSTAAPGAAAPEARPVLAAPAVPPRAGAPAKRRDGKPGKGPATAPVRTGAAPPAGRATPAADPESAAKRSRA